MGATTFFTFWPGEDMTRAFNEAVDQIGYEEGNHYSGTIADKRGSNLRSDKVFANKVEAKQWAIKDLDENDNPKWGPAWAVRIERAATTDLPAWTGYLFYGWAPE